jgi:hypothetical protein
LIRARRSHSQEAHHSHQAVHWAADQAVRTGRELVVTTAYDWHVAGIRSQVAGGYADDIRLGAEGVVEKAVKDAEIHAPGVKVRGRIVVGPAGPVLADCGPDDLVVVGNRGRAATVHGGQPGPAPRLHPGDRRGRARDHNWTWPVG